MAAAAGNGGTAAGGVANAASGVTTEGVLNSVTAGAVTPGECDGGTFLGVSDIGVTDGGAGVAGGGVTQTDVTTSDGGGADDVCVGDADGGMGGMEADRRGSLPSAALVGAAGTGVAGTGAPSRAVSISGGTLGGRFGGTGSGVASSEVGASGGMLTGGRGVGVIGAKTARSAAAGPTIVRTASAMRSTRSISPSCSRDWHSAAPVSGRWVRSLASRRSMRSASAGTVSGAASLSGVCDPDAMRIRTAAIDSASNGFRPVTSS